MVDARSWIQSLIVCFRVFVSVSWENIHVRQIILYRWWQSYGIKTNKLYHKWCNIYWVFAKYIDTSVGFCKYYIFGLCCHFNSQVPYKFSHIPLGPSQSWNKLHSSVVKFDARLFLLTVLPAEATRWILQHNDGPWETNRHTDVWLLLFVSEWGWIQWIIMTCLGFCDYQMRI